MASSYGEDAAKSALFAQYHLAMSKTSKDAVALWTKQCLALISQMDEYRTSDTIIVYVAHTGELDLCALAKTSAARVLFAKRRGDSCVLFDIEGTPVQPIALTGKVFALVPGLVFDGQGGRVGFAQGVYDRMLKHIAGSLFCVGVCRSACMAAAPLPKDADDILVDAIVSESSVWRSRA